MDRLSSVGFPILASLKGVDFEGGFRHEIFDGQKGEIQALKNLNDIGCEQLLEECVIHPEHCMSFAFLYQGKTHKFGLDAEKHPLLENGKISYGFVACGPDVPMYALPIVSSTTWHRSFLDAVTYTRIEGKSLEEIYDDPDSRAIDLS